MLDPLEQFHRDTIDELLQSLSVEERIEGLSVDELLAALSPEVREDLARLLADKGSAAKPA